MKKREALSFDTNFFAENEKPAGSETAEAVFSFIHETNHWAAGSSSGPGSEEGQISTLAASIPLIIKELNINKILDLPCGDFNWMRRVLPEKTTYIGGDIVRKIVEENRGKYAAENREFRHLNLIEDPLPAADLLFCRDCLVHFSFELILETLANIRRSEITYLAATTFTECEENTDIKTGDWRILNLCRPPFNFPEPLKIINEKCTEGAGTYSDKSIGIWKISDLPKV